MTNQTPTPPLDLTSRMSLRKTRGFPQKYSVSLRSHYDVVLHDARSPDERKSASSGNSAPARESRWEGKQHRKIFQFIQFHRTINHLPIDVGSCNKWIRFFTLARASFRVFASSPLSLGQIDSVNYIISLFFLSPIPSDGNINNKSTTSTFRPVDRALGRWT